MRTGRTLDTALAVLNGAVGDYLARSKNGLATEMSFVRDGEPLSLVPGAFGKRAPKRLAVFVHGLMCTETIWEAPRKKSFGARLERDGGFLPLFVRYNSGRAIADNGAALSALLDSLVESHPAKVEELLLVGYSMGGLLIRSACHVASSGKSAWLSAVKRAVYVGTPHRGAPMERAGRVAAKLLGRVDDPYARLLLQLAELRSDGVKDLGDADLRHADRARRQARFSLRDARHPVPLLPSIQHLLIAGTLKKEPLLAALFGDAVVPVGSARGDGDVESGLAEVKVVPGLNHLELPTSAAVYAAMKPFCTRKLS